MKLASILALSLVSLILSGYTLWRLQPPAIAYVDSVKLLNAYQGMVDSRKEFTEKSRQWQANVDTLSTEVQRAIRKYEYESANMSPKERRLTQELLRAKQKGLFDYQKSVETTAREEDNQSTSLVLTQVNVFLKKYGQQKGYDLILVANSSGTIAYAKEGLDLTADVLNGLNREYTKPRK